MRQRWFDLLIAASAIASMLVALTYFLAVVLAVIVVVIFGPVLAALYLRLLNRLERKRGTISTTTDQQEV